MPSWNRRFLAFSLVLLVFDAVWALRLSPRLLHGAEITGDMVYEADGNVRETFSGPQIYGRYVEIHSLTPLAGDRLEFVSKVYKLPDNELSWSRVSVVPFDRASTHIGDSATFAVFPPHVEARDYVVKLFAYIPDDGARFRFRGVEDVRGLRTFVFDYVADDLDWSADYTLELPAGTRITGRDWGTVWVEPVTGIVVNHREQWRAKAAATDVDVGSMWLSSDTVMKRVFLAQNMKRASLLYERVLPAAMLAWAVLALVLAVPRRRPSAGEGEALP